MSEDKEKHEDDNALEQKTKLYFLAQKLKDVALELDKLTQDDKKFVIERAGRKETLALRSLYDSLNDYMGW